MNLGIFYGIGVGPGDPDLITIKGADILGRCRAVFAPKPGKASESLALKIARRHIGPETSIRELIFPMTENEAELAKRWKQSAAKVAEILKAGHDACFITIGDPLFYSTYIYLLRALKELLPGLKAVTVPGITSFCAAAALVSFPLGEQKAPVTIMPADDSTKVRAALARGGTVVLMKIGARLREVLKTLEETGLISKAVFVSRAGQEDQRLETDLRKLKREQPEAGYLSVILVHA